MMILFYRVMSFIARSIPGILLAEFVTWCITTCYFIMPRPQVKWSMDFYRALFPGRSRLYYLLCSWKQFHHFSSVFTDRLIVENKGGIKCESTGSEYIIEADKEGLRGILLMSHIGNWELAARKLGEFGIKVALFVGSKQAQKIEAQMKKEISGTGIKILSVDENENAPFNIFEMLEYLKKDGFVSMTGDRIWNDKQRALELPFLGKISRLPYSPFALAYVLKVPLFVFFIIRTGRAKYRIEYNPPIIMDTKDRKKKDEVILKAAAEYLMLYEEIIRRHPDHWYCFEPFIFDKAGNE